ncbi:envelope biogenesis factor ElyC [Gammaproteobacteria bacterium AH-315-C21]|nr:envelope biogenesis factor ElyC [Gammaproteobacteria bacterium AH-315-C21]
MFFAKKILGSLLKPLPLSVLIALIGVYLIWFSQHQKLGRFAVGLALVLLISFSTPFVANSLIKPLEQQYPAILDTNPYNTVAFIVVLGGGHSVDDDTPISSHLSSSALKRLIEGLRLQRELPHATLIVSGGAVFSQHREANTMTAVIKALKINDDKLIIENNARDTASQASAIAELVDDQAFLLVTSAAHMPRSMLLMQQHGLNAIAAPTDTRATKTDASDITAYFPSGTYLKKSESAIHEYLGQWWAMLQH